MIRSIAWRTSLSLLLPLAGGCGNKSGTPDKASVEQNSPGELDIPWGAPDLDVIVSMNGIELGGRCVLDGINGKPRATVQTVRSGEPLVLAGWAADGLNEPPKNTLFAFQSPESAYAIKVDVVGKRPDVATALGFAALVNSGFDLTVPPPLPPGTYRLGLLFGGPDDPQACSFDHDLTIAQ